MSVTNAPIQARLHDLPVGDNIPPRLMGVLNLSRESFYPGSFVEGEDVLSRARAMVDHGADILDLGARSTAPWSPVISVTEETRRLRAGLELLLEHIDEFPVLLSIDTQYAEVLSAAIALGDQYGYAQFLLNDVAGFASDKTAMTAVLETTPIPVVLMPAREKPGDIFLVPQVIDNLREKITALHDVGVARAGVVVDPGIGRWVSEKTASDDLVLINELEAFRVLECPVLVAISRKSFIGTLCDAPDPTDRLAGTLAATTLAVYHGAHLVRTHDVTKDTRDAITIGKTARDLRRP